MGRAEFAGSNVIRKDCFIHIDTLLIRSLADPVLVIPLILVAEILDLFGVRVIFVLVGNGPGFHKRAGIAQLEKPDNGTWWQAEHAGGLCRPQYAGCPASCSSATAPARTGRPRQRSPEWSFGQV
jgi:hypothetical protein